MKKKDETKRKHNKFRIVALFAEVPEEDPIIFVARSKMKDLRKLFSYFKRECKYTKEFFEPGITAELFLLDDQWRSKASAYYHQIAWKRYFFEADFDVAGDLDTYENSLDLYGAAACIFQELSKIPLEEVMGRRYTHTSKTVEKEKEQKGPSMKKPGPLTERLSIRLSETEHRAFLDYCNKNDLTQREGLQMLLAGASGDGKYEQSLALEQNYRMKKIEEEIAKLRKTPRSIPEHQKLKEAFRFARQGVLQYIKMAAEQLPNTDKPMECIPWHEMKHTIPHYKKYAYPEQDAFFVFRVQTMCYGHGDYIRYIWLPGRPVLRNDPRHTASLACHLVKAVSNLPRSNQSFVFLPKPLTYTGHKATTNSL